MCDGNCRRSYAHNMRKKRAGQTDGQTDKPKTISPFHGGKIQYGSVLIKGNAVHIVVNTKLR